MAIRLWCIRVSQARPGDARRGEDVSRGGEDVSRDELSLRTNCLSGRIVSPLAAGTGDHKDYRNPRKAGQGENRRQGRTGGNANHRRKTRVVVSPTGKVSRGNVKTAKSCHNGNDLGGGGIRTKCRLRCDCARSKWTGWQLLCMRFERRRSTKVPVVDGADRHYVAVGCGSFAAVEPSPQSVGNHSMCNVSPLTLHSYTHSYPSHAFAIALAWVQVVSYEQA